MSIATEKELQGSERFLLVRINPGRYIEPVVNGAVYEITMPFLINRITRNGVALTKVSSTPSNNDEWYQNETTKLVQVKLASAPNDTTNILIANYYLFYTGTIFRDVGENPELPTTNIRAWNPLILNYPSIIQSFDNIVAGVFTINDTSVEIINTDESFQEYLTEDDSFFNKGIDIWLCINAVTNIQKIFTGVVKSLDLTSNKVSLRCADSFNSLKQTAYFNDTKDEASYTLDGFPNIDPKFKDKPCPYIIGKFSRYNTEIVSDPSGQNAYCVKFTTDLNQAACTSYDGDFQTNTNRTWGLCRQKGTPLTQSWGASGAITTALNLGSGRYFAEVSASTNIFQMDTAHWVEGGNDYYAYIEYYGPTFTYLGNNYNLIIQADSAAHPFTTSSVFQNETCISLMLYNLGTTAKYFPKYDRDYTLSSVTTSGGNEFYSITFTNNFEASVNLPEGILNPNTHPIYYRISSDENQLHGDTLKNILDYVGLPYNASTFTTANTDLAVPVRMSVPNFDEQDYQPYLKYVQDILSSALSFLRINSDFEVEYYLLEAPTATDSRDDFLMLSGQTGCAVEYQDIQTTIIAFNPHNTAPVEVDTTPTPSETRSNAKAQYLNGIENTTRFRHCLETITDRIDAHMGLKSMRKATYRFQTATKDIDSEVGGDLQIDNKIVIGSTNSVDVKIVTIQKSPQKTSIEAVDFKGL